MPRELPADVAGFTGRSVELAELDLLLPAASPDGAGRAVGPVVISAVSGTAGVGKTALAVRWAHRVAEAFPAGQLYVNLRGYDPDQPVAPGDALAGFLRALGVAGPDIPLETAERAARYRSLVAGKRLLVVLDNAAAEEQVRPLLPGSASVMVVVTSRDSLAGLVARDGARRLDLDLLPIAEAVALLRALIGWRAEADPEAAEDLARLCARLPLALRVAAELAAARPDTPLAALAAELAGEGNRLELLDAGGDPRAAVASVFSWSYRHLPAAAAADVPAAGPAPRRRLGPLRRRRPGRHHPAPGQATTRALGPGTPHPNHRPRPLQHARPAPRLRRQPGHRPRQRPGPAPRTHPACSTTTSPHAPPPWTTSPPRPPPPPSPPPVTTPIPVLGDRAAALEWLDTELANFVSVAAYTAEHGWPSHTTRLAITLWCGTSLGPRPEGLTITGHA